MNKLMTAEEILKPVQQRSHTNVIIETDAINAMQIFKHQWLEKQKQFCETCVPKATAQSSLIHLVREIDELHEELIYQERAGHRLSNNLLMEYVDCALCIVSSAIQYGYTPLQIMSGLEKKISINLYERKWKENPDGTYSHVK